MMTSPYLHLLTTIENVAVWRVDGKHIRDHIDIEFTNGSEPSASPYIPSNEIWIDREPDSTSEWRALAPRLFYEYRFHSDGTFIEAEIRRQWRTNADLYIATLAPNIFLVNGKAVRDWLFTNFVHGGHWLVYDFIPKNEVWIDNAILVNEFSPTIQHELFEIELMKTGMPYNQAHAKASQFEREFRKSTF